MKKGTLIVFMACMFLLALSISAFANNGPHRGGAAPGAINGGFAQDTDGCAGCHRAHTGVQQRLLKSGSNVWSFCTSCHDGTGANSNVVQGLFEGDADILYEGINSRNHGTANRGLNGGGFANAVGYTGRSDRNPDDDLQGLAIAGENYGAVTSTHTVEGINGTSETGLGTVWGGGTTGRGVSGSGDGTQTLFGGAQLTLKCTSCHDPHGNKNADGSERYRLLLGKITRDNVTPNPDVVDISGTAIAANGETLSSKDYTSTKYKEGTATFCAACHTQYNVPSSSYDSNDTNGNTTRYRHPVTQVLNDGNPATPPKTGNGLEIETNLNNHTQLPVEQSAYNASIQSADKVVCLSCHQAHGTKASMTDNSKVGPTAIEPLTGSSTLLRLNNRGVCQDCHQK